MDCTLTTLIACFSWSGLYLDTTAEYIDSGPRRYTDSYYGETLHIFTETGGEYIQRNLVREVDSIEREASNPYLRGALGYEIDLLSWRLDVSAFYQESARASDRGEFGGAIRVRWFPFRRH